MLNLVVANLISTPVNISKFRALATDGPILLEIEKTLSERKACSFVRYGLSLSAKKIRGIYNVTNKFVLYIKHVLIKNKINISMYSNATELSLIKFPILTRWRTFINCVKFNIRIMI